MTSHGIVVPSITPLESASETAGTGMPMGSAPASVSSSFTSREPPRIFMPSRSAGTSTGSAVWNMPGPCTHVPRILRSANSPSAMCSSNIFQ